MFGELAEEEKARWVRIVVAAVLAGSIIMLSQDMTQWLLGIDISNPEGGLPQSLIDVVGKIFLVAILIDVVGKIFLVAILTDTIS